MKRFVVIISIFVLGLSSCDRKPKKVEVKGEETVVESIKKEAQNFIVDGKIVFNEQESKYIEEIKNKGELVIVTRIRETVYEPAGQFGRTTNGGIEYSVAKALADYLEVNLKVNLVPNLGMYFAKDGIAPDNDVQSKLESGQIEPYTPDVFNEAKIIVDGMSSRPWREKLVTLVQTSPDKDVIVVRHGVTVNSLDDLVGLRIAIVPQTAYAATLKGIEDEMGVKFNYVTVADTKYLARTVSEGKADVTALGGITSLMEIKNFTNLNVSIPLSETQANWSNWAVKKDDLVMASILKKYFVYAKNQGIYDKAWLETFGITFMQFIDLLKI